MTESFALSRSSSVAGSISASLGSIFSGTIGLVAAVRPPPPIILVYDTFNFSKWSTGLRAILGRHGLLHHIDGSAPAAPTDPARLQDDYAVLTAMHSLISRDVLDMIQENDDTTALELWTAAESLFSDNKDGRCIALLGEFHGLVQGDLTVAAYCREQKRLADALRDAGSPVDNRVLVLNVVRGLSPRLSQVACNHLRAHSRHADL